MAQPKAPQVSFASAPTPPSADTSTAQLIHGLGTVAGNVVKGVQEARLQSSFQDTAEAAKTVNDVKASLTDAGKSPQDISAALQAAASFDPSKDAPSTLDGLDLPDNVKQKLMTIKKKAGDSFNAIAQAVSQGAMTENAAALKLEAVTRRLVNETPGFGPEIKQLAREVAGYDPTNYDLQQVLDINKPKGSHQLTAEEKQSQEADAIVAGLHAAGRDIPKNVVLGNLALQKYNEAQNGALKAQLSNNDISFQAYVHQTTAQRGPDLSSTLVHIASIPKERGGITQPQDYVNVIVRQREADKQELRKTAATYAQGVSNDQLAAADQAVDRQYQPLIDAVKDNGLGKLLDERLGTVAKLNQLWGEQTLPNLTRLVQAFPGSRIPDQLVQMMANTADPAQFQLLTSFDPGIKALVDQGIETTGSVSRKLSDTITKIMTGKELSSEDTKFEPLAERVVITAPNSNETREKFIDSLATQAPIRATSLLATSVPRDKATKDEAKFMKRQYDIYLGRPDGTGNPTLVDTVAQDIPKEFLKYLHVDMQKKTVTTGWDMQHGTPITVTRTVPVLTTVSSDFPESSYLPESLKKLQVFVNAVTNGYGKDFGVTNPDTFAQDLVHRIQEQATMSGTIDRTPPKQ